MESEENDDFLLERYSIESFFFQQVMKTDVHYLRIHMDLLRSFYSDLSTFRFEVHTPQDLKLFQDCNLKFDIDFDGCVIELQSFIISYHCSWMLCHVAAVKSLPALIYSADYILLLVL